MSYNQDRYRGTLMPDLTVELPEEQTEGLTEEQIADLGVATALEKYRIRYSDRMPPQEFLFQWTSAEHEDGSPIATIAKGELTAITGKAKSGKTFLTTMLAAAAMQSRYLYAMVNGLPEGTEPPDFSRVYNAFRRPEEDVDTKLGLQLLWIDTEQSEASTHELLTQRILPMGKTSAPQLRAYNIRQLSDYRQRGEAVRVLIDTYKPELVILDGIRDLVADINSYEEAQAVVGMLLELASKYKTAIVVVLHQNKAIEDKTLRGAIGTELQNKSFETFECAKDEESKVLSIRQVLTRRHDIPGRFYYRVDPETGLPAKVAPVIEGAENEQEERQALWEELRRIFDLEHRLPDYAFFNRLTNAGYTNSDKRREFSKRCQQLELLTRENTREGCIYKIQANPDVEKLTLLSGTAY